MCRIRAVPLGHLVSRHSFGGRGSDSTGRHMCLRAQEAHFYGRAVGKPGLGLLPRGQCASPVALLLLGVSEHFPVVYIRIVSPKYPDRTPFVPEHSCAACCSKRTRANSTRTSYSGCFVRLACNTPRQHRTGASIPEATRRRRRPLRNAGPPQ